MRRGEECRFRSTRKKIRSNDTSEHVKFIYFFFIVTGRRMKFKRQSVSFFFFFLTFGVADGRSIESRNLRCFRALADFEPCCAPSLFWWPIGRHMTRTLQLRIATCLRPFLFLTILKFFAIFFLLFPLRFS